MDAPGLAEQRVRLEQFNALKNFTSYALCGLRVVQCDVLPQGRQIANGIFVPLYSHFGAFSS